MNDGAIKTNTLLHQERVYNHLLYMKRDLGGCMQLLELQGTCSLLDEHHRHQFFIVCSPARVIRETIFFYLINAFIRRS